jgi:hypothetical protein
MNSFGYKFDDIWWQSPDGLGVRLRTLNSRIRGSNSDAGSIYTFGGVIPGLGFLHSGCDLSHNLRLFNLRHSRFTAQISSIHWVVIRDEIHMHLP